MRPAGTRPAGTRPAGTRIIAGAWRGRRLLAPPGLATRPTADRVRQAMFDMLVHAPWGGPDAVDGVHTLDAFAGSGALGLEALSRGAAAATFIDQDQAAIRVLRANIGACSADQRCTVIMADVLTAAPGRPCGLVFLDPPYGRDLVSKAIGALGRRGWIRPGALIVAETGRDEAAPACAMMLAERVHGAARISIWRVA
ncbi:MAG TPA: 16S rRNA (guanine(966)-N(2))-methyltransferase RsmD [Acetobacteraceae bacterium]|nr:16S rRNA (guanine(966)-N(2))-methyltransferase RsmD [Acetobacteraceae bacterium]